MSINKVISIKNPILDAIINLGLDNSQDMPVFATWAIQAEKAIRSYRQYEKKRAVLDIENCRALLPSDAIQVQRAVLGDLGCGCEDLLNKLYTTVLTSSTTLNATSYQNSFLIVDTAPGYTCITDSIPHTIQDNQIILDRCYNGQKLTIQYIGYKIDEEGLLMVSENHVMAITEYICFRYYMRKKKKNSLEYGQMNKHEETYHRQCRNARALDGELTESERDEITSIINDPLAGISLPLGTFGLY